MGQQQEEEMMVMLMLGAFLAYEFTPILDPVKTELGLPMSIGLKDALLGGGGGGAATPATPSTAGGGGGGAPAGGPFSQGTTCPRGQSCTFDGKDRWECEQVPHASYEATWCGTATGNDNLSIKMWGPNHTGSNACCWCIMNVGEADGGFSMRMEGPHPSTGSPFNQGGKMGALKNTCVKAVIHPGPKGAHIEGYGLTGGAWKKYLTYDGVCGQPGHSETKPASGQQVSFRFDVPDVRTTCATVAPLGGGAAAVAGIVEEAVKKKKKAANFAYTGGMRYLQSTPVSTLHTDYSHYSRIALI